MIKYGLTLLLVLAAQLALKAQNSGAQDFNSYCASHGWYLSEVPQEKIDGNKGQLLPVTLGQDQKVDLAEMGIEFKEATFQYFQVNNSHTVLIVKSLNAIRSEWEQKKKEDE